MARKDIHKWRARQAELEEKKPPFKPERIGKNGKLLKRKRYTKAEWAAEQYAQKRLEATPEYQKKANAEAAKWLMENLPEERKRMAPGDVFKYERAGKKGRIRITEIPKGSAIVGTDVKTGEPVRLSAKKLLGKRVSVPVEGAVERKKAFEAAQARKAPPPSEKLLKARELGVTPRRTSRETLARWDEEHPAVRAFYRRVHPASVPYDLLMDQREIADQERRFPWDKQDLPGGGWVEFEPRYDGEGHPYVLVRTQRGWVQEEQPAESTIDLRHANGNWFSDEETQDAFESGAGDPLAAARPSSLIDPESVAAMQAPDEERRARVRAEDAARAARQAEAAARAAKTVLTVNPDSTAYYTLPDGQPGRQFSRSEVWTAIRGAKGNWSPIQFAAGPDGAVSPLKQVLDSAVPTPDGAAARSQWAELGRRAVEALRAQEAVPQAAETSTPVKEASDVANTSSRTPPIADVRPYHDAQGGIRLRVHYGAGYRKAEPVKDMSEREFLGDPAIPDAMKVRLLNMPPMNWEGPPPSPEEEAQAMREGRSRGHLGTIGDREYFLDHEGNLVSSALANPVEEWPHITHGGWRMGQDRLRSPQYAMHHWRVLKEAAQKEGMRVQERPPFVPQVTATPPENPIQAAPAAAEEAVPVAEQTARRVPVLKVNPDSRAYLIMPDGKKSQEFAPGGDARDAIRWARQNGYDVEFVRGPKGEVSPLEATDVAGATSKRVGRKTGAKAKPAAKAEPAASEEHAMPVNRAAGPEAQPVGTPAAPVTPPPEEPAAPAAAGPAPEEGAGGGTPGGAQEAATAAEAPVETPAQSLGPEPVPTAPTGKMPLDDLRRWIDERLSGTNARRVGEAPEGVAAPDAMRASGEGPAIPLPSPVRAGAPGRVAARFAADALPGPGEPIPMGGRGTPAGRRSGYYTPRSVPLEQLAWNDPEAAAARILAGNPGMDPATAARALAGIRRGFSADRPLMGMSGWPAGEAPVGGAPRPGAYEPSLAGPEASMRTAAQAVEDAIQRARDLHAGAMGLPGRLGEMVRDFTADRLGEARGFAAGHPNLMTAAEGGLYGAPIGAIQNVVPSLMAGKYRQAAENAALGGGIAAGAGAGIGLAHSALRGAAKRLAGLAADSGVADTLVGRLAGAAPAAASGLFTGAGAALGANQIARDIGLSPGWTKAATGLGAGIGALSDVPLTAPVAKPATAALMALGFMSHPLAQLGRGWGYNSGLESNAPAQWGDRARALLAGAMPAASSAAAASPATTGAAPSIRQALVRATQQQEAGLGRGAAPVARAAIPSAGAPAQAPLDRQDLAQVVAALVAGGRVAGGAASRSDAVRSLHAALAIGNALRSWNANRGRPLGFASDYQRAVSPTISALRSQGLTPTQIGDYTQMAGWAPHPGVLHDLIYGAPTVAHAVTAPSVAALAREGMAGADDLAPNGMSWPVEAPKPVPPGLVDLPSSAPVHHAEQAVPPPLPGWLTNLLHEAAARAHAGALPARRIPPVSRGPFARPVPAGPLMDWLRGSSGSYSSAPDAARMDFAHGSSGTYGSPGARTPDIGPLMDWLRASAGSYAAPARAQNPRYAHPVDANGRPLAREYIDGAADLSPDALANQLQTLYNNSLLPRSVPYYPSHGGQ